jgi:hypothetical protein
MPRVKLRLTHVVVLMLLVLAAGVLSARHLAADAGATVPGLVVVDAGQLPEGGDLSRQAVRFPGSRLQLVGAGLTALAPLDESYAQRRAKEGAATALVSAAPLDEDVAHRAWQVAIGQPPRPAEVSPAERVAEVAADYLAAQTGVRAFVLALQPGPETDLAALVARLEAAASALPRTRRTSLVILGARDQATGQRLTLRLDRGPWGQRARPALADLLEDAW